MTHRETSEGLYCGQPNCDYPDLLLKMPRYCCPVEIILIGFLGFIRDITEI